MSVQENHAHIDKKYAFNIQMVTEDVNLFWSKRNIQKLSTFYSLWAQDLIKSNFDPFGVLEQFYQTLEELLNPSSGEQTKVSSKKEEGSCEELLTRLELQSVIQSYKTNLAHKVALATLQVPSKSENLKAELEKHSTNIQRSYRVLNANTNRIVEKTFQFSEIDLITQEKIALINCEIETLFLEFETAFLEPKEALFNFIIGQKGKVTNKQPFIERLSSLYLKKIAILKSLNLTTMSVHLDWATSMIMIRSKIEACVQGMLETNKMHSKFVKAYKEIAAKEIYVVEISHTAFLEASGKYEKYNALISANIQDLFLPSLKEGEIFLYDFDKKQFTKVNLTKQMPDELSVASSLEQILLIIRLLINNSSDIIEISKAALGPIYTLSNAIVTLFNKMYKIQKEYLTHKGRVLKVTENFDREVQETICKHIEQAYQFALSKSSEGPVQLKNFFAPGSKSHFYLKLALDLKIHTGVKPKEMPDTLFLDLIEQIQTEVNYEKEDAYLDAFPSNRSQKSALKYYHEIRELDQKSKLSDQLMRSALEIKAHKVKSIIRIFENQGKALIQEIIDSVDTQSLKEIETSNPSNMSKIALRYTKALNLDAFCKKHREALFYIDLLVRVGNGNWSFQFSEEITSLNQIHILILEKLASHFRLDTLRITPAARDIIALAQLVQSDKSQATSEVVSIQEAQKQVAKRIRKTREKFTEILIHGLRSYHSMLSTLSTFLDWEPKHLQMMFENYLIKEHLKKEQKSNKKISNIEVRKFRTEKLSKSTSISSKAATLAGELTEYLQYYRTLQLYMIQFYNGLGNIVFQDPDYMQLKPLSEEDIDFLESKLDEIKIGYFNDIDEKTALFIKPHLQDLKKLIKEHPLQQQAKAVNRFLQTKMLHEDYPPLTKGLPLHFAGVSYMSIKLLIRTILIIEKGSLIKGLNMDLFTQLFASQNSPWKKFSEATSRGVGAKVENELGKFIKSPYEGAPPLGFYYDIDPQNDDQWEYYQVKQPFLMMTAIITVQNKWNSYLGDLMNLLDEQQFSVSFKAIQEAAISLNESERLRSTLKPGSSLKKRNTTTIFSTLID